MTRTRSDPLAATAGPEDLRRIPPDELPALAARIREHLVTQVRRRGGHLGPNLGVVELTIAVHRVFDSPRDAIVWDTGHQAYVHKMLTGRAGDFGSLRGSGGLSGYPSRAESVHDIVENSHASTSLSYADGLAKAFALTGDGGRRVVAIVGDGALTGGLCWEALNNIGAAPERPVVVVLNDNGRSYEPTAGRLAVHLRALRAGSADTNLFDSLGLAYVGPVDGHDVCAVEAALRSAAALRRPVVVHCVTRKGAGDAAAEDDEADHLHTVPPASSGGSGSASGPAWTDVFGAELLAVASERPDVVAVTAAMLRQTGLLPMAERFPDRVFDVGIAEQHAVASAAGLAAAGLHPVVAIYSTFLSRAFDQVLMDTALHRAPVTFVLDRAGITGPDGPSHHGMWDVPLLRLVPGMRIAAPRDTDQLRVLFRECVEHDGPAMVRFPRGRGGPAVLATARWGSAEVLTEPRPDACVLLLPVGPLAEAAVEAAGRLTASGVVTTVVDPRWIAPVEPLLVRTAARHQLVVSIEDNAASGGFGDGLSAAARAAGVRLNLLGLALPDTFVPAGERGELLRDYGLDAAGITRSVLGALDRDNAVILPTAVVH